MFGGLLLPACISYSSAESLLQSLCVGPEWDPEGRVNTTHFKSSGLIFRYSDQGCRVIIQILKCIRLLTYYWVMLIFFKYGVNSLYLMFSEGVQSMPDGLIQLSLLCLSHGQTGGVHFQPFLFHSCREEGVPLRGERQGLLSLRTLLICRP